MEYNMSFKDVIFRYVLMMAVVITGGLMHEVWIMAFGLIFFLTGLLGWCPLYSMLGINNSDNKEC